MGGVQIGDLRRKRVVRKMDGSIIDWSDDTDGSGAIIVKGRVINQPRIDLEAQRSKDKELAAKAEAMQVSNPAAPDRNNNPSKMVELEKRVDGMDEKLNQILKALTK